MLGKGNNLDKGFGKINFSFLYSSFIMIPP